MGWNWNRKHWEMPVRYWVLIAVTLLAVLFGAVQPSEPPKPTPPSWLRTVCEDACNRVGMIPDYVADDTKTGFRCVCDPRGC